MITSDSQTTCACWLPRVLIAAGSLLLSATFAAQAENNGTAKSSPASQVLRVCADPSNMPFSNKARQGFENKIAALLGDRLDVPVEYEWAAEQMGFGRNTLKKYLPDEDRYACDLIISVGSAFEVGKTTLPYYRSTYVMAFRNDQGLDGIDKPSDLLALPEARRKELRIGVFTGSPVASWMLQNGLLPQLVSYRAQSGGYDVDPADMITQDLVNGDIDIAMAWGPIAGYYAKNDKRADIELVPFTRGDGSMFDFPVSMGVRYGNDAWLTRVQHLIDNNRDAIIAILEDYGVPLVPLRDEDRQVQEDDDD